MKHVNARALGALVASLLCSGCATSTAMNPSAVPAALRPPPGQVLYLEVPASGVQIYECAASKDDAARFEWTFRAPEAVLLDRAGRTVGKHYGGPTWESLDGSIVVGEVRARDNGTDANAIPWLLLGVKSTRGEGSYTRVRSIQRLETVGGKAPSQPCSRDQASRLARVPYTATYYFYADNSYADKR